jgi:hypothetical protein
MRHVPGPSGAAPELGNRTVVNDQTGVGGPRTAGTSLRLTTKVLAGLRLRGGVARPAMPGARAGSRVPGQR